MLVNFYLSSVIKENFSLLLLLLLRELVSLKRRPKSIKNLRPAEKFRHNLCFLFAYIRLCQKLNSIKKLTWKACAELLISWLNLLFGYVLAAAAVVGLACEHYLFSWKTAGRRQHSLRIRSQRGQKKQSASEASGSRSVNPRGKVVGRGTPVHSLIARLLSARPAHPKLDYTSTTF